MNENPEFIARHIDPAVSGIKPLSVFERVSTL
jgi:hypothetical protein